jgi:hypothetical protein
VSAPSGASQHGRSACLSGEHADVGIECQVVGPGCACRAPRSASPAWCCDAESAASSQRQQFPHPKGCVALRACLAAEENEVRLHVHPRHHLLPLHCFVRISWRTSWAPVVSTPMMATAESATPTGRRAVATTTATAAAGGDGGGDTDTQTQTYGHRHQHRHRPHSKVLRAGTRTQIPRTQNPNTTYSKPERYSGHRFGGEDSAFRVSEKLVKISIKPQPADLRREFAMWSFEYSS